jgi:alpha-tubulin suppressor-like RCC1 family protein
LLVGACDAVFGLEDVPDEAPPPPPGRWAQVAVGDGYLCGIDLDDALWCWGSNASGQLGLGGPADVAEPTRVGDARWKLVSAAVATTCGVQMDSSLWCWGANASGQVGNGDMTNASAPVQIAGAWSFVSAGRSHTCAIDVNGAASCWGTGLDGQLGTGVVESMPSLVPKVVMTTESWLAIDAGDFTTCALDKDRRAWCWGRAYNGELGNGTTIARTTPGLVGPRPWHGLQSGRSHSCGLRADGVIACWGSNGFGQLGDPNVYSVENPNPVLDAEATFVVVGVGTDHSCAAKVDGTMWCWGANNDSQSSSAVTSAVTSVPQQVRVEVQDWTQIAAGPRTTCAITADHNLWCWGADVGAALAQITPMPTQVDGTWKHVEAAFYSTCAIRSDDSLACWGENSRGQLGDGSRINRYTPVTVGEGPWRTVDLGETETCALDSDGDVWCWGYNSGGLGDGANSRVEPTWIASGFSTISVGGVAHALRTDGTLWCWGGSYYYGHCGNADGLAVANPTQIGTDTWTAIGTGSLHACGTTSAGMQCWGSGYYGQLGDGLYGTRYTPAPIIATPGLEQGRPSAGDTFTCAIQGTALFCWGSNLTGELGGASAQYYSPTPLQVPGEWREVATGAQHACAIAKDGTLWCWGSNTLGQLGIGNVMVQAEARTQVSADTTWTHIAAADAHTCGLRADGALFCWGQNAYGQLGIGGGPKVGKPRLVE